MAYTPTVWQAGDTVTVAKLNKMEQGIASCGGVYLVNIGESETTGDPILDKTAAEIWAAAQTSIVIGRTSVAGGGVFIEPLVEASYDPAPQYSFTFGDRIFGAYSDSAYPTVSNSK